MAMSVNVGHVFTMFILVAGIAVIYASEQVEVRTTHLGNLLVDNENHTFGNDVTYRSHRVINGGRGTFIDINNQLPSGLLTNFYIFLTDKENAEKDSEYIRLQIWRYKSTVDKYTLVWEQRILFTLYDTGTFYDIDVSSLGFNVQAGDFIGWTIELDSSALVLKVVEKHGTYHKSNVILPILEESFTFSDTFSGQFSIAVRIEIGFNSNYLISLAMVACLSY